MEKVCLRWNEFETNIRESFKELREEQNQFDVTLVCDDNHQIQAHKIILSAGSKFFCDIFMKTKNTNVFLYFKGIKSIELEYVVDYLYNGEVLIAQEGLNKFLETSRELQVKGLQSIQDDQREHQPLKTNTDVELEPKSTERE